MLSGGFGEPLAYSLRIEKILRGRRGDFDIIHDNQCMGPGVLRLHRRGLAPARDAAPSDHRRPLDRARPRRDVLEALHHAALVRVLAHAGAHGEAAARGAHGVAQLQGRHQRADGGALERLTVVPVGRGPRGLSPLRRRRQEAGAPHGHLEQRRADEGTRAPARGGRETARRTRHRPDRHRQAPPEGPRGAGAGATGTRRHRDDDHRRERRGTRPALRRGGGRHRAQPLRGVLPAGHRGHELRRARGGDDGRGVARGRRRQRRDRACWSSRTIPTRWWTRSARCSTTPSCARDSAPPGAIA